MQLCKQKKKKHFAHGRFLLDGNIYGRNSMIKHQIDDEQFKNLENLENFVQWLQWPIQK